MATSQITEAGGLGQAITPEQWASFVLALLSAQSAVVASGATGVTRSFRVVNVPGC